MSDGRILRRLRLAPSVVPTGKTRHFRGGELLPAPAELQIVVFSDAPGYVLLYLDVEGREMTDTLHDSLEAAIDQAEWEFNVKAEDWVVEEQEPFAT